LITANKKLDYSLNQYQPVPIKDFKMRFPLFQNHEEVTCFHCNADLKDEDKAISNNYSGKYYKNCTECGFNTYYDVPKGYVK